MVHSLKNIVYNEIVGGSFPIGNKHSLVQVALEDTFTCITGYICF